MEIATMVIPAEQRATVLPLIERLSPAQALQRLELVFKQQQLTAEDRLRDMLRQGYGRINDWTRACAARELGARHPTELPAALLGNLFYPEPLVRQAATLALEQIDSAALANYRRRLPRQAASEIADWIDSDQLPMVSKTESLRACAVLSGVPLPILARLAPQVPEQQFADDQTIFEQGELGDHMYVVASGRVRIDIGGRPVAELGVADILGEIALLESTQRVATAISIGPSRLLRVGRQQLNDLLADHLEILPAMIRVITRRRV